ncbi:MAG: trypsin-like peptidase domain-containing protein, partial [Clostridia bacterium]|nr:trypsin-like peptidase domain-containing protein [Clostridia bacterium]
MNEFDNKNQFPQDEPVNNTADTPEVEENTIEETAPAAEPTPAPQQNPNPQQYQSYGNPYGYNTQGNSQGYGYTPYNYSQGNAPYGNPYPQQNPYGQGISYTPAKKKKEKKKKSGISGGAIALLCCLTIILSAVFGFGGAYVADRYFAPETVDDEPVSGVNDISFDTPVVIYRDVEDIQTSTGNDGEELDYAQVAAIVKDSVVEITTEYNVQSVWYNYVTQGAGSGVIISENGYIITNAHVITGDSGEVADNIIVRLTNTHVYNASVVGYDTDSDIAVIKIEETGLTAAVIGSSDNLAVGEELVVVGNPLGELGGTVTNGIVSATEREIDVNGVTMSLIQTNAAVSPGNSGGGMFNMKGQLVGIINAKSSGSGVEGLGFAIPVNTALTVTEQLMEYG